MQCSFQVHSCVLSPVSCFPFAVSLSCLCVQVNMYDVLESMPCLRPAFYGTLCLLQRCGHVSEASTLGGHAQAMKRLLEAYFNLKAEAEKAGMTAAQRRAVTQTSQVRLQAQIDFPPFFLLRVR